MAEEPNDQGIADEGAPSAETSPASRSKVDKKVELDLDDAPFLEDDEPEPEPEPKKAPPPVRESAPLPDKPSLRDRLNANRKKLILAGGGAVVLLIAAIAVNMLLFSDDTPPQPVAPEPEKVLAAPKTLPPAPTPQFLMQWEPFWVELKDTEGAVRFLTCTFSIPTDNQVLFAEMNVKKLILRDALFYYLRNQPILSLTDTDRVQVFKSDLLTVLNEHLSSGKANELLIQDYLVQ